MSNIFEPEIDRIENEIQILIRFCNEARITKKDREVRNLFDSIITDLECLSSALSNYVGLDPKTGEAFTKNSKSELTCSVDKNDRNDRENTDWEIPF